MTSSTEGDFTIDFTQSNLDLSSNLNNKLTVSNTSIPWNFNGYEACLQSASIPYCTPAITANTFIGYNWTVGSTTTLYNVPILALNGATYEITDYNQLMWNVMETNGHYLIGPDGKNVYYAQLTTQINYETAQIVSYVVPTSLPSGFSQPSNFAGFPSVATNVQVYLSDPLIMTILGWCNITYTYASTIPYVGYYPSSNVGIPYNTNSPVIPQVGGTLAAIIIHLSVASNSRSTYSDKIYITGINVPYDSPIIIQPTVDRFYKCSGSIQTVSITLTDQNNSPIKLLNPQWYVSVYFRPIKRN